MKRALERFRLRLNGARVRRAITTLTVALGIAASLSSMAGAATVQNPQAGSNGLQGTISSPPPTKGATITTPVTGASFTALPITVNGLCPAGLLVKLFANDVFVGSVQCTTGSYTMQVDLFSGKNDLIARVYDQLDQAGPDSNTVTVTFNDNETLTFGSRVTLSSPYGRKGADPGSQLDWPIIISGGSGPYALSVDWGDNSPVSLQSVQFAGNINISHTYKNAGVYKVVVKATDVNGTTAFLQLVGVANGKVTSSGTTGSGLNATTTVVKVIWWPAAVCVPLLGVTFWLGRRSELLSIRHSIEDTQREAQAVEAAEAGDTAKPAKDAKGDKSDKDDKSAKDKKAKKA
jgi:hypothetical protein